mgnify:CR=1 FL=1
MTAMDALQEVLNAAMAYENLQVSAGFPPDSDLELAIMEVKQMVKYNEVINEEVA